MFEHSTPRFVFQPEGNNEIIHTRKWDQTHNYCVCSQILSRCVIVTYNYKHCPLKCNLCSFKVIEGKLTTVSMQRAEINIYWMQIHDRILNTVFQIEMLNVLCNIVAINFNIKLYQSNWELILSSEKNIFILYKYFYLYFNIYIECEIVLNIKEWKWNLFDTMLRWVLLHT